MDTKKIIRIIFSVLAGFGITILAFIGSMLFMVGILDADEDTAIMVFAFVIGTISFGILSIRVYDYLKK